MSADNVPVRMSTYIEQEAAGYLRDNEIPIGDPVMAEKRGNCDTGNIELTTNVYGIVMNKQLTVYRYDATITGFLQAIEGAESRIVDLTKKGKGDAVFINRRERCRDVMLALKKQEDGKFFKEKRCIYYDLQSIVFSLDELNIDKGRSFTLTSDVLSDRLAGFDQCVVELRPVAENGTVQLGDMSSVSRNLLLMERALPQFLDIATSQYAMFTPSEHVTFSAQSSYLMNPSMYKLNDDTMFEDTCSYLSFGAQKGVRLIEGPARSRAASLVISSKKTPFHGTVNLLQKVQGLVRDPRNMNDSDYKKLALHLKGLSVETCHLKRPQRFDIRGLSSEGSNSLKINVDGKLITIEQYFWDKYEIQLKEPKLPMVETLGKDKTSIYFPIELCTVSDNQRVKTNQQTSKMTQISIRKCAVPPSTLRFQNEQTAESLHLWDSEWLTSASIQVLERPVNLGARSIAPPDLDFAGNEKARMDTSRFTWTGRRFFAPQGCKVWAAYAFLDSRDRLDNNELEKFLVAYVEECSSRGMKVAPPAEWDVRRSDFKTIQSTFKFAADNNCEFVFAIHSDTGDAAHADIKYSERCFDLVSQAIKLNTLRNVMLKNQRLTLSNIVNKTNMKLGGLNYTLSTSAIAKEILGSDTLYIGFGMNHPGGGLGFAGDAAAGQGGKTTIPEDTEGVPSVVGYAANVGDNNEFDFVGDFVFQAALREEKANVISDIVTRCLEYYNKGRKHYPKRVILYRNGCSEGQFRMVLQYEIPLIKKALINHNCNAKITVIVANKLQSIRFFNKNINNNDKPPEQNIRPGVVVDHTVVHPVFAEFFLNSHRALQGTTRTPKYTVLYDDNSFKLEELEHITFHLCFGHQIVFMPTSLPTPIYIANRYAERGRMLFQRWAEHDKKQNLIYHELTDKLCFYNSRLFGRRVNA